MKNYAKYLNFDCFWKKLNRPLTKVIKRCSKYDIPRLYHLAVLLKLDVNNFDNYSSPWHIINSPVSGFRGICPDMKTKFPDLIPWEYVPMA